MGREETEAIVAQVLVIEDDPDYADVLCRQLSRLGHRVESAGDLARGIELARSLAPDLVFLDVNLPDGSGLNAIRPLMDLDRAPEVVVMTGAGDPSGAELAIRSGAWDYLSKSASLQDVALVTRQALGYRREKAPVPRSALDTCGIVGKSRVMREAFEQLARAAATELSVLITGETGTGKELFALAVHRNSVHASRSFVVVDCAALPDNLVESVLFGHRRGAFTGAVESRVGLLELADGGTLCLDEVGELPLAVQKSFLRALQERRFRPLGAEKEVESRFRLVAATNRDLEAMVREGQFREDLLFRLQGTRIHLPPLRGRESDVVEIAREVVARACEKEGLGIKGLSPDLMEAIAAYAWPGNVRELVHAMEHAVAAASQRPTIYAMHLPTELRVQVAKVGLAPISAGPSEPAAARELGNLHDHQEAATAAYLQALIRQHGSDLPRACAVAGLSRSRLYALLKEHGIKR